MLRTGQKVRYLSTDWLILEIQDNKAVIKNMATKLKREPMTVNLGYLKEY